ncbi:DUF2147 domain-containing protein [Paracoccus sp. (in: a-proteobacteria)]|uniref:DUF2147 domain-containing protein n=1 Tax=Paracoccus sp. TaxID=267 RepID=UPI003A8A9B1E
MAANAASADPIEGIWQTQPDNGFFARVSITPCAKAFCGTIAKTYRDDKEVSSPNIGRQILIDMVPDGNGGYQGRLWRPSNNKVYIGKARLSGNSMSLSGCVAGGLLCKSQTWSRVK